MSKETKDFTPDVILFTDGACSGNPGPGGWAFILRHLRSGKELICNGGEADTTNNRMELTAVIVGLRALKRPTAVEIVSDSAYVLNGLSTWMKSWKANGWRRREKGKWEDVKNVKLWQELDLLVSRHEVYFTHVRGHAGHPENEHCDRLATEACRAIQKKKREQTSD
ncbi:MAG: ribonuclease HI [Planctomycetaceae bacterium]|jgi:ribonuclease HI|nr:ribonuclease HI [Planctomycetaceae bacterium]